MSRLRYFRNLSIAVFTAVLLSGGCKTPAGVESSTGLLIQVRLHENATVTRTEIEGLRFFIGVRVSTNPPVWVLDGNATGIYVALDGWDGDLRDKTYDLLIYADKKSNDAVKVVVTAEIAGAAVAIGAFDNPDWQEFQSGSIVSRTVQLEDITDETRLTWTTTGCLTSVNREIRFGSAGDMDCDGYESIAAGGADCQDLNPFIHPAASDSDNCDGLDNDCNGVIDDGGWTDNDNDGFAACEQDCDDRNPSINPNATEVCDGVDNNCDGQCDESDDEDQDGYTTCGTLRVDGQGGGPQTCVFIPATDCDDVNPNINPGAAEACDGIDNNCNFICDEGFDEDGDGFNDCGTWDPGGIIGPDPTGCLAADPNLVDCDPGNGFTHPGAREICDGEDNDCNGDFDTINGDCWETAAAGNGTWHKGQNSCSETQGSAGGWGSCALDMGSIYPNTYCGLYNVCTQLSPDPEGCVQRNMVVLNVNCQVHMNTNTNLPCRQPPVFYSPFGFSNLTTCEWDLTNASESPGAWTFGLVDPSDGGFNPTNLLNVCDAGIVAYPVAGGASMNFRVGFFGTGTNEGYFLDMNVDVQASYGSCNGITQGMVCVF